MPFVCTQQSYSTLITAVTKILQQTKVKKTKNLPETDTLLSNNSHLLFLCFFFFSGLVEGWESRENAVALFGKKRKRNHVTIT